MALIVGRGLQPNAKELKELRSFPPVGNLTDNLRGIGLPAGLKFRLNGIDWRIERIGLILLFRQSLYCLIILACEVQECLTNQFVHDT
jgi:hypothetical protein